MLQHRKPHCSLLLDARQRGVCVCKRVPRVSEELSLHPVWYVHEKVFVCVMMTVSVSTSLLAQVISEQALGVTVSVSRPPRMKEIASRTHIYKDTVTHPSVTAGTLCVT